MSHGQGDEAFGQLDDFSWQPPIVSFCKRVDNTAQSDRGRDRRYRRPPAQILREALPHTAPPLGVTVKMTLSSLPAVAARNVALQKPALCPVQERD